MATFRTEWDSTPNPSYDMWTSVNGSEVIPGIVSPLTASVNTRFDRACCAQLLEELPTAGRVALHEPPTGNFFGVFAGRLALNNAFGVAALSLTDGEIAQAILQQFFTGAAGGERYLADVTPEERAEASTIATARREEFETMLDAHEQRLRNERASDRASLDLQLPVHEAWARFVDVSADNATGLLPIHLEVSGTAGEWQVRLGGTLEAAGSDPRLVVALCSGLGEVESSKPAVHLYELARLARELDEVGRTLTDGDLDEVIRLLADRPGEAWGRFADRFERFLLEYGFRVQGEADPTNADWSERPQFALSQVRAMMAVPEADSPSASIERAAAARVSLEAQVAASIPAELAEAFDQCRTNAQRFTRMRERSKAVWVMGVRRARAPYLAVARSLSDAGVIDDPDDLRFLMLDEVDLLAGGGTIDDLRERVTRRRAQADEAEWWTLPDNWVGEPELSARGAISQESELHGLGVSVGSGPVTGTARIIPSTEAGLARDIEVGDILVAPYTDTPWTPLFITAGAVVVETGGVLSHAATVAREFGIPAVAMVADATRIIRDGDTVTVDGATGSVTIVQRA